MDKNSKEAEIKRINDVLHKFDSEKDVVAPYEQAADLSSLTDADPEPIMLTDDKAPDASAPEVETKSTEAPAPEVETETPEPVVETEAPDTPTPEGETEMQAPVVEAEDSEATARVDESKTPEAPEAETKESEQPPAPAVEDAEQDDKESSGTDQEKKERKFRLSKSYIVIIALSVCMLLGGVIFFITHPISPGGDADSSDSVQTDVITCTDGTLNVNNVSVKVPVENASYNITYTWGPKDEEFPTVPHSVTSAYYGEGGKLIYDITLSRDSVTAPEDIPKGKDASNWFSDWPADESENNIHVPKDSGSLHGFMVYTIDETAEDSEGVTCGNTSYYFAIQDEEGLSQYILQGILYDKASLENYQKVMEDCINSIKVS